MTIAAARHSRTKRTGARRVWLIAAIVTLPIAAVGIYAGVQSWGMASSLMALSDATPQMRAAAESGDIDALTNQFAAAHTAATAAADHAEDWSVRALASLPVVGNDIEAARVVAQTSAGLTDEVADLLAIIEPGYSGAGDAGPGERLTALQASVRELSEEAGRGNDRLAAIDVTGLKTSQLAQQIPDLAQALDDARVRLDDAQPQLAALIALTANDQPRTWLVINQNLTEARGSGGLLSTFAVISVHDGVIELKEQGTNDDLAKLGPPDPSSAPMELRDYWGDELNEWWGLNESAHFPTTGTIIVDSWNALSDTQVDGVVTFGQGTVQYLAAASGPVTVGGKTIEPADLSTYLTETVYHDYPDPRAKDEAVEQIIGQVFGNIAAGDLDIGALVRTVITSPTADYVQAWSADSGDQGAFIAAGLDGELPDELGPVASVRAVNVAGNKLEAFMHLAASYELGECVADEDSLATREGRFTVAVSNDAPASGLPSYMTGRLDLPVGTPYVEGTTLTEILIYPPVDAVLGDVYLDGEAVGASYGGERNREFVSVDVELAPGQTREISLTWQEPAQDNDGVALSLQPEILLPPLINEATVRTPISVSCRG